MFFDELQTYLGTILYIVLGYGVISFLISLCGWRQLANKYPANSKPSGIEFRNVSGYTMLLGAYRRCLNVVASPVGVYVEVQPLFSLFHKPILFPWKCISEVDSEAGIVFHHTLLTITDAVFTFRIRLPLQAAEALNNRGRSANA